MKRKAGIFFAALISMQGIAHSATVDVIGANGVSGANGIVPGSDGQNGTDGGPATAQVTTSVLNTDTTNQAIATGGHAGNGGNGADGLSEPGLWDGGNGGNGGTGGAASATSDTTSNSAPGISAVSTATGGGGGRGGQAGLRADLSAERGVDGVSGDGGTARASSTASHAGTGSASASATAIGGTGGDMIPSNRLVPENSAPRGGTRAGNGGIAELGPVYAESLSGGRVNATGRITGGNGGILRNTTGDRTAGMSAGSGANASLVNAVDGSTTGRLSLTQTATGGTAGSVGTLTGYGNRGSSGTALSSLTKTTTSRSLSVITEATGGNGSGFGISNAAATFGGSAVGGDGATATAHSTAINLGGDATALATALGGQGGGASSSVAGIQAIRGNGADASATAHAEAASGFRASATARQTGGSGDRGGDAIMVDAVSGSSDFSLTLEQVATGGSSPTDAQGGNASSSLTATNGATGFSGGWMSGTALANGGRGSGSAFSAADISSNENVSVSAVAIGGASVGNSDGGSATLGRVSGTSLSGGDVIVSAHANGGGGSGALSNGASVSVADMVFGSSTGNVQLMQAARGGDGDMFGTRLRSSLFGLAGDAFSSLSRVSTDTIALRSQAVGGDAGRFIIEGVAADGGLGTAHASDTNTGGSSDVGSISAGGDGGMVTASISRDSSGGTGGDAMSTADTTVIDGTSTSIAQAFGSARGGDGGGVNVSFQTGPNLSAEGGDGGNANSISVATANSATSIRSLFSSSRSIGGAGGSNVSDRLSQGGDGGNAFAQATSVLSAGAAPNSVNAIATAQGGAGGTNTGGGLGGRGGNATAIAEVIGASNAFSTATVIAGSGGQGNVAGAVSATALISQGSGTARAEIDALPFPVSGIDYGFVTLGTVTSVTRTTAASADSNIEASLSVGNTSTAALNATLTDVSAANSSALSAAATGLQSVTRVNVMPDAVAVDQVLSGNSGVASNFDLNGGSDMLALMTIGAMQDGSIIANSFSNDIGLSMDMSLLSTQQDLIFGFMNPVISGNGFDSMTFQVLQEGTVVLDMLFNDVVSAESFFSDQTVNLGDWTQGLVGDLDLSFFIDFDISGAGDGFYFDTAYGNSTIGAGVVPVPGAAWLFGSGLIALLGYARKRQLN